MSTPNAKRADPEGSETGKDDGDEDGASDLVLPVHCHLHRRLGPTVVPVDGAYDYSVLVSCEWLSLIT